MSMPEFPTPNPDMTREQALNMILTSIALEELALSHIINAEGEKIQYVLGNAVNRGCSASTSEILAVNKSVTSLLEMVMQNQLILKNKMEKVLECLPPIPAPPEPPCPPAPPCPPRPQKISACFQVIPCVYKQCSSLQWHQGESGERFLFASADIDKICLPRTGRFLINIAIETYCPDTPQGIVSMELRIDCLDKNPICKLFCFTGSKSRAVLSEDVLIQMPCSCSPCYASVIVRSPDCIQIKQGYISFTRA